MFLLFIDPITAIAGASLLISAGSALAGHKAEKEQDEANREAARRAFMERIRDINLAGSDVEDRRAASIFQVERQARSALALERVSQGEAGVAGVSARAVREDLQRDAAEAKTEIEDRAERDRENLEREKDKAFSVLQNRLAGATGPNPFLTGLQIGGAALRTASIIDANQTPQDTR